MNRLKVMSIVGTRPEIIRLSRVLDRLDRSDAIEHITVHTGQNYDYELNQIFYDDLGLKKPDYYLDASGRNSSTTIGQIIIKIDEIFEKEMPGAVLILGDTNSCLCAIPAKKRHIPIFHMEAGNRCFDFRVPEETNRRIVDHVADMNLTYSDIAREYLLNEGFPPDRIIKTGSPMYEVLEHFKDKIAESRILESHGLLKNQYFVFSAHREENIEDNTSFYNLIEILRRITEKYQFPIIFSTHPRTRKRLEKENSGVSNNKQIKLLKPLSFTDYNALQINAFAVLSDSGTISEESSILNFRALNLREAHERPESMEEANVMMVGLNPDRVMRGLSHLESQSTVTREYRLVSDYSMPNVSEKVVRIILSYTDYINRVVWSKAIH
jgi:UDP-N-acetyl-L-fucosamine synthase